MISINFVEAEQKGSAKKLKKYKKAFRKLEHHAACQAEELEDFRKRAADQSELIEDLKNQISLDHGAHETARLNWQAVVDERNARLQALDNRYAQLLAAWLKLEGYTPHDGSSYDLGKHPLAVDVVLRSGQVIMNAGVDRLMWADDGKSEGAIIAWRPYRRTDKRETEKGHPTTQEAEKPQEGARQDATAALPTEQGEGKALGNREEYEAGYWVDWASYRKRPFWLNAATVVQVEVISNGVVRAVVAERAGDVNWSDVRRFRKEA